MTMDDWSFNGALHAAAEAGDATRVSELLSQGADANYRINSGVDMTPLMLAAVHDHPACIDLLLKAGAQPNESNQKSETALGYAVENNNIACARLLIEAGSDVNLANVFGKTPLIKTIQGNSPQLFEILIAAGADIRGINTRNGWTPLKQSVLLGNEALSRRPVELGDDVDDELFILVPSLAGRLKRYQDVCRLKALKRAGATPSTELGL